MSNYKYSCPVCKSTSYRVFLKGCKDILYRCSGEWTLLECIHCQVVYTVPILNEGNLLEYYPADYSPYNILLTGLRERTISGFLRKAAMLPYKVRFGSPECVQQPFGEARLLEVGCGSGEFLKSMTRLGWKCWGLDVSPLAVKQAKKSAPDAVIIQSTLTEVVFEEPLDVIAMFNVLEHLPDPVESLHKCFEILAPGGKLLIGIPNVGSYEAKLFGRYWRGLDIPRHLFHFRESELRRLIEACGFTVLKVRPMMFASSISESLIMLLPERIRYCFLHSRASRYLYLLMVFPAALSYLLGNRGLIELVAQKPYEQ